MLPFICLEHVARKELQTVPLSSKFNFFVNENVVTNLTTR